MNKETKAFACTLEIKQDATDGLFEGYVAVFNNTDYGGDIIAPGAFDDEIAQNPNKLYPLLHQHETDEVIGGFKIKQDTYGLKMVDAFFNLDVQRGKESYSNAKKGVLTGFSIGYGTKEFEQNQDGTRLLTKLKLYEGSIVTFPMNDKARLTSIKSLPETEREFEKFLRDAGFSREQSKTIVSCGFKKIIGKRDASSNYDESVKSALTELENTIKRSIPNG